MTNPSAAVATTVSKFYGSGDGEVRALDDVSVQFEKGKFTAIMGPSGSGKSTFMHCMAGLDALTSGNVSVGGTELAGLSDKALTLKLQVDETRAVNELIMYAENLGTIPPNTALMVVNEGDNRYEVRISSALKKSGVIRFIHKPK